MEFIGEADVEIDTNRIIGLYAPQDYGKTFLVRYLIETIAQHVPVVVYDTNHEATDNKKYGGMKNVYIIQNRGSAKLTKAEMLDHAIRMVRRKMTNFFLVIEDIDKLTEGANRNKKTPEIFDLSSDSRHQRIGIIYMAKEPTNIPPKLRSNTTLFLFGNFVEPAHVKYIGEIVDKDVLKKLVRPTFLMYDRRTQQQQKVIVNDGKLMVVK